MKNKSARHWAERLFNEQGISKPVPQSKVSHAHRNHENDAELEQSPFSVLFSEVDKEQTNRQSDKAHFQSVFEQTSPIKQVASGGFIVPANSSSVNGQFSIVNCFDETPDTKTFRLGLPDGQTFDYLPGQYITLSILISGEEYKRSYSLASNPDRSNIIEITVKRAPNGGIVSNWLNDHLKIGDTVSLKGPYGKFTCVNHTHEKTLFLAAGSGIVPIMSMLRWLANTNMYSDIALLLSFRSPDDIIYRDELNLITARHKNINLDITLTSDNVGLYQWSGLTGRVNEQMIGGKVPDLQERTVYVCGPDAFISTCKDILLKLKLPAEKIFYESYTVNSPINSPQNSGYGQPARRKSGKYRINFARTGKTFTTDGQMTILEIAMKYGIKMTHECRNGTCGECMIKCLKGKVDMTEQAEIDDADRKKGWVYACCAYPASNVVMDI